MAKKPTKSPGVGDNLAKEVVALVDQYAALEEQERQLKKLYATNEKALLELFGQEIDGKVKLPPGTVLKGSKKKLIVVSGTPRLTLKEELLLTKGVSAATIKDCKVLSAVPLSWKVEDL